jgi:CDP-6-deoxy-D-xylo-4-hexulose-3-dehydrase
MGRNEIEKLLEELFSEKEKNVKFVPGKTRIQFAGPVYGASEVKAVLKPLLNGWLIAGELTHVFEQKFAELNGVKGCITVNSGTSALILAWNALMNDALIRPLKKGDEIITCVLTHPSTVNSLIHNGLVPVLVDADKKTLNMNIKFIEQAITKKTRGILPMHFLGNPCEMDSIMEIAKRHDLYVVEDACDSYGAKYGGRYVGSFGDLAAVSFYTAHGITLGEGGAVLFNEPKLGRIVKSLRDWGRACWCKSPAPLNGECGCRFEWKLGDTYYDHRYLFDNVGFNLKIIELQAAFGLEQLKRFPYFIKKRRENFQYITRALKEMTDYFIFPEPAQNSDPVWFTIPITIREDAPFFRKELEIFLNKRNIETRPFFAGYLPEQPAYKNVRMRVMGDCQVTRLTKKQSLFIGCYPGITEEMREYVIESFKKFFRKNSL